MQSTSKRRHTVNRVPRIDREGMHRTRTRVALANGDWDDLPSTQPARINRRPSKV